MIKANNDNLLLTSIMSRKTGACQINGYEKNSKPFYQTQSNFIKRFIRSAQKIGVKTSILFDDIDDELLELESETLNFKRSTKIYRNNHCDNRFYLYRDFLKSHPAKNIFLTDCNDVYFNNDPFKIFSNDYYLYVGSEYRPSFWCEQRFLKIRKSGAEWHLPEEKVRYNMGIIGGKRKIIIKFLDHIIDYMEELKDKDIGANTPAGILTLHNHFNAEKIFTGMPLHNHFRMAGKDDKENTRGKAYIVHK